MSLRIIHNITALDALGNLTLNTGSMARFMEKLSSGCRINRAADDSTGVVLSKQFKDQIAGLNKEVKSSEISINMIQTVEEVLTKINKLLVRMKELAIHAANDEIQLAADQTKITNTISTINSIAANTQFETKKLLDGVADNVASLVTGNNSQVTLSESAFLERTQDARPVIGKAINEMTTIRGTLDSFQKNTLESNLTNLRIEAQNLIASESTIKDADMAK